jgi:hypothetical protein
LNTVATAAPVELLGAARRWLHAAAGLSDAALHSWTAQIGGVPIRFRCTDPTLADLYRERLVGLRSHPQGAPFLCLDLLETEPLDWPAPSALVKRGPD